MKDVVQEIKGHKDVGYKPSTGIFASNTIFAGDFEDELANVTFYDVPQSHKEMEKVDAYKGQQAGYKNCSFRSHDGKASTYDAPGAFWDEEDPKNYKWTEAYDACPQLASMLDWFECPIARVRVFQQQPGHVMATHSDFDNQKGTELGETLRIFVQLNENKGDFHYRFQTADSDVSIQLQKGQFLIFNPDKTAHGTANTGSEVRNAFMLVVKKNEWLENLMKDDSPLPTVIDCKELAKERKVA